MNAVLKELGVWGEILPMPKVKTESFSVLTLVIGKIGVPVGGPLEWSRRRHQDRARLSQWIQGNDLKWLVRQNGVSMTWHRDTSTKHGGVTVLKTSVWTNTVNNYIRQKAGEIETYKTFKVVQGTHTKRGTWLDRRGTNTTWGPRTMVGPSNCCTTEQTRNTKRKRRGQQTRSPRMRCTNTRSRRDGSPTDTQADIQSWSPQRVLVKLQSLCLRHHIKISFLNLFWIGKLTAAASGVQHAQVTSGHFHLRRAAFFSQDKVKTDLVLAKAEALPITLNIDGAPIVSRSHTHPSRSQTSRLLTSSLSLGIPVARATQCIRDV